MDARKSRFAPNTPDPLCANYTWHLMCFARYGSIQRSSHPSHKFGIFICDINANTCQKNRARTNLLKKTKIKQDYYCSSLYLCHTKAMTTLVEYGTRCLYGDCSRHKAYYIWNKVLQNKIILNNQEDWIHHQHWEDKETLMNI